MSAPAHLMRRGYVSWGERQGTACVAAEEPHDFLLRGPSGRRIAVEDLTPDLDGGLYFTNPVEGAPPLEDEENIEHWERDRDHGDEVPE